MIIKGIMQIKMPINFYGAFYYNHQKGTSNNFV